MLASTVLANIMLKIGASKSFGLNIHLLNYNLNINIYLIFGIFFYLCAFFFYYILLHRIPLYLAQCFIALQFVLVIISSFIFFRESITFFHLVGFIFITFGLLIVAIASK